MGYGRRRCPSTRSRSPRAPHPAWRPSRRMPPPIRSCVGSLPPPASSPPPGGSPHGRDPGRGVYGMAAPMVKRKVSADTPAGARSRPRPSPTLTTSTLSSCSPPCNVSGMLREKCLIPNMTRHTVHMRKTTECQRRDDHGFEKRTCSGFHLAQSYPVEHSLFVDHPSAVSCTMRRRSPMRRARRIGGRDARECHKGGTPLPKATDPMTACAPCEAGVGRRTLWERLPLP